jgi:hypothetical protein
MGRKVKGTHRYSGSGGEDNTDKKNVAALTFTDTFFTHTP